MIYVKMKEKTAVEREIIPADHPYPTNGKEVIFKRDILVQSGVNVSEEEIQKLTTAEALKMYDLWQM